ncbi:MAG TPA: carotenoid 1,2-hydratase [Candidatus Limnocylindria bacterium]|nr:carotenoid 1,2-hydratase [Candidatus Limnocylindria bacterium]
MSRAVRAKRSWFGRVVVMLVALVVVAGCSGGGPILANPPLDFESPPPPSALPSHPADPIPVVLPRDDGPHQRLTEWWYYTGHLKTAEGRRFGFEAVVFRAERSSVPVAWASHLALTDEQGDAFHYAQRSEVGRQVDASPRDAAGTPTGFDLGILGLNPALVAAGAPPAADTPWHLAGAGGTDRIEAALTPEEAAAAGASFGLSLDLRALKPPALHDGEGFVDFGPAGSSYYYSRTQLAAEGSLTLDGETLAVDGTAWFDHQWGDFVSVGGGGWDWFAINLDNGTDITVSIVLDRQQNQLIGYGTLVAPNGAVSHLDRGAVNAFCTSPWTSPATGYYWATSCSLSVIKPDGTQLAIELRPTVQAQELDTRATTGVVYWEGSQIVEAQASDADGFSIPGGPLGGEAYVERTRYSP